METEVGGASRCKARVSEQRGCCSPASAEQDAGKEVGGADLSPALSQGPGHRDVGA